MAPAGRLGDRAGPAPGIVEIAKTGISIGLEDAGIAGEMPVGVTTKSYCRSSPGSPANRDASPAFARAGSGAASSPPSAAAAASCDAPSAAAPAAPAPPPGTPATRRQ
jgi:hypothetical protein